MKAMVDIPPLESGDRLTRAEFHRRYLARPDIKLAELIEGVVYVASPVWLEGHGSQHATAVLWAGLYVARTPGLDVGDNATVMLDADNEVQPDVFLFWREPGHEGAFLREDRYVEGPPPLVIEIAATSASKDLHDKMNAYRRAGVLEYIVWRTLDGAIDWFRLHEGAYVRIEPDGDGMIESGVFPGPRLDVPAMPRGDRAVPRAPG
jgi:Uma2 family endonuclease